MKVVIHEDALRELREANEWYASQRVPAKGQELMRLVDARIAEVARAPESFPRDPKRSWARRARILRWPFSLVFTMRDAETVVVLAIAHGKRRPGYWTKRRERVR
jgi:plasmid stabilization system protein ParE